VDEKFQNLCLFKVNRKFSLEGERGGIEKLTKRSKVCSSSLIWNLVWRNVTISGSGKEIC
jgi:hypothetical protein